MEVGFTFMGIMLSSTYDVIPYLEISSLERAKHNFLSNIFLFQHPGRSVGCSGDIGRILKLIAPCNNRSGAN